MKSLFFSLGRLVFKPDGQETLFQGLFFLKEAKEKLLIVDQNHGLTPLKKTSIGRLGKIFIFQSR